MCPLIILAFSLVTLSCFAQAESCTDIRNLSLRNATIQISPWDENDGQRTELLALRDGRAFLSDDPSSKNEHDWEIKMVFDRVIQLQPSTWARVTVLEGEHLSGTGTRNYVLVFGCENGSLARLFQYDSEGVRLKQLHQGALQLYEPRWEPADGHCCPTRHRTLTYRWSPDEHQFDLLTDLIGNGFEPLSNEK